jgi:phytepsin
MFLCSIGIESVVDENNGKASSGIRDAMCPACEMAVVWMQSQIKQNQTLDYILNYVNEVKYAYGIALHISLGH